MYKLFMNSLSGKFVQKLYETVSVYIRNSNECDKFLQKTNNQRFYLTENGKIIGCGEKQKLVPKMPSIYGVLIY